jgi:hypothetical protein
MTAYAPYEWFELSPAEQSALLKDMAELERMLAVHHAPARRYAARQLSTLATSSEITSLPACTDRVVVSTFSTETNA